MQKTSHIPVYKVGAVILRWLETNPEVLIVRTKPKKAGEVPQLVLPRGSRQYKDEEGQWIDVRIQGGGSPHPNPLPKGGGSAPSAQVKDFELEPLTRTLEREIEEEAGLGAATLAKQQVVELGARDYASRTKGTYPVHWFIIVADEAAQMEIRHATPVDTSEVRWVDMEVLAMLAQSGEFAAGYVPVVKEALKLISANEPSP